MATKTYAMKSTALAQDDSISLSTAKRLNTLAGRDLCSIGDLRAGEVRLIMELPTPSRRSRNSIAIRSTPSRW